MDDRDPERTRFRTIVRRFVTLGVGVAVTAAVVGRDTKPGRAVRRGVEATARRVRDATGRLDGLRYRLAGRSPDPTVSDDVLADRIRSNLGRVEKRLDLPRVHVMVTDHVALLHGEVPADTDRAALERAVRATPGVRGVESFLHIGLGPGTTRPSVGHARDAAMPSPALRKLLDAAQHAGASDQPATAVRAVLATFTGRIPVGEREQLFAHLPQDVRAMATAPRSQGEPPTRMRTVSELVEAMAVWSGVDTRRAAGVTEAVLGQLRSLVREEADDVAAVLPEELRQLWEKAVPG